MLGLLLGEKLGKTPGDAEGLELGLSDGEALGGILGTWLGGELGQVRHWGKRSANKEEILFVPDNGLLTGEVLGLLLGE